MIHAHHNDIQDEEPIILFGETTRIVSHGIRYSSPNEIHRSNNKKSPPRHEHSDKQSSLSSLPTSSLTVREVVLRAKRNRWEQRLDPNSCTSTESYCPTRTSDDIPPCALLSPLSVMGHATTNKKRSSPDVPNTKHNRGVTTSLCVASSSSPIVSVVTTKKNPVVSSRSPSPPHPFRCDSFSWQNRPHNDPPKRNSCSPPGSMIPKSIPSYLLRCRRVPSPPSSTNITNSNNSLTCTTLQRCIDDKSLEIIHDDGISNNHDQISQLLDSSHSTSGALVNPLPSYRILAPSSLSDLNCCNDETKCTKRFVDEEKDSKRDAIKKGEENITPPPNISPPLTKRVFQPPPPMMQLPPPNVVIMVPRTPQKKRRQKQSNSKLCVPPTP